MNNRKPVDKSKGSAAVLGAVKRVRGDKRVANHCFRLFVAEFGIGLWSFSPGIKVRGEVRFARGMQGRAERRFVTHALING